MEMPGQQITDRWPDGASCTAIGGRLRIVGQTPFAGFPIIRRDSQLRIPDLQDFIVGVGGIGLPGDQEHFADCHRLNRSQQRGFSGQQQSEIQAIPATCRNGESSGKVLARRVVVSGGGSDAQRLPRQICRIRSGFEGGIGNGYWNDPKFAADFGVWYVFCLFIGCAQVNLNLSRAQAGGLFLCGFCRCEVTLQYLPRLWVADLQSGCCFFGMQWRAGDSSDTDKQQQRQQGPDQTAMP
jgi:hypothetical protein